MTPRRAQSVDAIRRAFASATSVQLASLLDLHQNDDRSGVREIVARARRRLDAVNREDTRLCALYRLESELHEQGVLLCAGVDEVGRGALAGPLTAGACILPARPRIDGLDDSKRLSPKARERLAERIREVAVATSVSHVPATDIDAFGLPAALRRAMTLAVEALDPAPAHVIVDGLPIRAFRAETAVVKGDSSVAAIAAASILAKVERDALMLDYASEYPHYGFDINKGYGTAEHITAIANHGPCVLHRTSFSLGITGPTLF